MTEACSSLCGSSRAIRRSRPRSRCTPITPSAKKSACRPRRVSRWRCPLADAASPYAGLVETALAAAPRAIDAKDFGELKPDGPDGWRLCAAHEPGAPRDLFVEPPAGWWVTAAPAAAEAGRDCFKLRLRDKPKDAALPVALRLTMTGGAGPVETTMEAAASN